MGVWYVLLLLVLSTGRVQSFLGRFPPLFQDSIHTRILLATQKEGNGATLTAESTGERRPCFYRPHELSRWLPRLHLEDLKIGQKLKGHIVQELLDGRTGPKVFFECGIGRTSPTGEWQIVNGMLRLDRGKTSVTKKRVARLRKKGQAELFVSRIQLGCGRLEVCAQEENVAKYQSRSKKPISSLKAGDEVAGQVVKLLPYGVLVNIGANRNGLLHIQKVADLYGHYIDKEKGLQEAGLEHNAKVRLVVESNVKRRVSLDFTDDVKSIAESERQEQARQSETAATSSATEDSDSSGGMSDDELSEWANFATGTDTLEANEVAEPENPESDDSYDEDGDIEDQFGLGFY